VSTGKLKKGDPRARELGRKGGLVRAEQRRKAREPFDGTVIDLADAVGLTGPSRAPIRAFLKAIDGLPMSEDERALVLAHTERSALPSEPVREALWLLGRRSGKTHGMALVGFHRGISFDPERLTPGEKAVVMILAADRAQAGQALSYLKAMCELDEFKPYVHRVLRERVELRTGINIEVHTSNFRTTRGYTVVALIADEVAFWRTEDGAANPDREIMAAVRPAMATVPGALLLMGSTPYARTGETWRIYQRYFGEDDPHVIVFNADTATMNPQVPADFIARAFEEDATEAASEYGDGGRVVFRTDVQAFLDPEALRAVVMEGRRELPPMAGVKYSAFCDPSGGSQDSMTIAIAHREGDVAVLDAIREIRPPFDPDSVTRDFAALLKTYGLSKVVGDRYGGSWPAERFKAHGITYEPSSRVKSDIYKETLPLINAGRVALLDSPVLFRQFVRLERRVARGGKDSIDHPKQERDDVANAAAGALVEVGPTTRKRECWAYSPLVSAKASPSDGQTGRTFNVRDGRRKPETVPISFPRRR
jgi:hypothetical protein